MATDDLADFWVHTVTIARFLGRGPAGDTYDPPTPLVGFVDDTRKLVRDPGGSEVVSSTTVMAPATTELVPVGSKVTLPATFGARTAKVVAANVHDSGDLDLPDHLELNLA